MLVYIIHIHIFSLHYFDFVIFSYSLLLPIYHFTIQSSNILKKKEKGNQFVVQTSFLLSCDTSFRYFEFIFFIRVLLNEYFFVFLNFLRSQLSCQDLIHHLSQPEPQFYDLTPAATYRPLLVISSTPSWLADLISFFIAIHLFGCRFYNLHFHFHFLLACPYFL